MQCEQTQAYSQTLSNVRPLIEDLFEPNAKVFWLDLLISSILGWSAFIMACSSPFFSWKMVGALSIAILALYRALVFAHELTHLPRGALPNFSLAWNLCAGIPLLIPSFLYVGVHLYHHSSSTYGTVNDPEYLPFAQKKIMIMTFLLAPFVIPALLISRFLILTPIGLVYPRFHRFLEARASSITMNLSYRRTVNDSERRSIKRVELIILLLWIVFFLSMSLGVLPFRVFSIWYFVLTAICLINAIRTLGAHRYESESQTEQQSMNRVDQVVDSIDTPGTFVTELWAPVGLRYHALHHYYPSLPYHNLKIAYDRIHKALPSQDVYRKATSPSLLSSLRNLWSA